MAHEDYSRYLNIGLNYPKVISPLILGEKCSFQCWLAMLLSLEWSEYTTNRNILRNNPWQL